MKRKIVFLVSSLFAMSLVSCSSETSKPNIDDKKEETFTITWVDDNGNVLEVDNDVKYGELPSYDRLTPTKKETDNEKYVFNGWLPSVKKVTSNQTYVASFISETKTYTVSWINDDGTVLAQNEVPYGSLPNYYNGTPTKEGTDEYHYEFAKWVPELSPVTSDTSYSATYNELINTYTVTWENYDGTVLKTLENVPHGEVAHFDLKDPTREENNGIKYSFKGWNVPEEAITEDTTYVATYTNQYEVDFNIPSSFNSTIKNTYYDNEATLSEPTLQEEIYDEYNNKVIDGWYYDEDLYNKVSFPLTVNKPLTLYPKIVDAAEVTYTNGRYTITSVSDKIESLTFDSSFATAIDTNAISSLSKLKRITIPSSFYGFTGYDLNYSVTSITVKGGYSTFAPQNMSRLSNLKDVTFENGATGIGTQAFNDCSLLTDITFSESITSISEYAFYNTKLKEIVLPSSLRSIGSYAFKNTLIEEVEIPSGVTSIGAYAFDSEISKIFYLYGTNESSFNQYWNKNQFVAENRVIYNYAGKTFEKDNFRFALVNSSDDYYLDEVILIKYLEPEDAPSTYSLTIPSTVDGYMVKGISDYAFLNNTKLQSVFLNENISSIGEGAFMGCSNLTDIYGNNAMIQKLGAKAFKDCTLLSNLNAIFRINEIKDETFKKCKKLTNIFDLAKRQVNSIGNYAFSGSGITTFSDYTSLNYIGEGAFYECKDLTNVVLSNTIKIIQGYAFSDTNLNYIKCKFDDGDATIGDNANVSFIYNYVDDYVSNGLSYILVNNNGTREAYLEKCGKDYDGTSLYLSSMYYNYPYSISRILSNAFSENTTVVSVSGYNIKTIDNYAFEDSSISTITFTNATNLSGYSLYGASSLTSICLSGDSIKDKTLQSFFGADNEDGFELKLSNSNLTKISKGMFEGNTQITSIDLSECANIQEIEDKAFRNCTNLKTVKLPYSVKRIGDYAFYGTNVMNVNFTNLSYLQEIGSYAFYGCGGNEGFGTIDLSNSSTLSINSYAFNKTKIKNLILPSSSVTLSTNVFDSSNKFESIKAPASLFRTYSYNVTYINQSGINSAKKLSLTGSEEVISNGAFSGIQDIEEIDLSMSSITTINGSSFNRLDVTKVTLSSTLENISTNAFSNCSKLTSLIIPSSVLKIENNAFNACPLLHLYLNVTKEETSSWGETWFGDVTETNIYYKDTWSMVNGKPEANA